MFGSASRVLAWRRASALSPLLFLPALLALTGTGCTKAAATPPPSGPPQVGVVALQPERVVLTTELPGRTSAYLVAEVRPQVNGLIKQRAFVEGSDVRAGSLLYQIDPAPYKAAYEQAKAALSVAEANVPATRARAERLKELVAIRAVGQQDYDDAQAALAKAEAGVVSAKAAVESARINVAYTPLASPISGRIGRSSVTVGALVTAYQPVPLAVVQQLDPIYVDVTQSSAELLRLKRSLESGHMAAAQQRKVRLLLEDGTPYGREGTLQFRDVSVEPSTGAVVLRMVFPNPDRTLLPGMFVRAVIEEGTIENGILVPQQGVTRNPKGDALALVVNAQDTVEQRRIQANRAIGDAWLVSEGLRVGDRLVVEGIDKVRPGAKVRPVPAAVTRGAAAGLSPAAAPAAGK